MTGQYPHATGCIGNNVPLPAELPTFNELFPSGDYVSAYHGKWHLGDEIFRQHGFDEWISIEDMYAKHYSEGRDADARSDYHHFLVESGFTPDTESDVFSRGFAARLPEEYGKPAFLAQEAARFIGEHTNHPFMLFINFLEPHMPFFGPRDDQYDLEFVDLPPNFGNPPTEDQHLKYRMIREGYEKNGHSGLPLKNEADWRRMIAHYWGLNSLVDTHVGAILRALEENGLTDETIIVFTSDHGDMMGSHQMLAKTVMFEEATRVPLLIRLPGGRAQRIGYPVNLVDLVPTLLELMGHHVPGHVQGISRVPDMEGTPNPGDVFLQFNSTETGILERYNEGDYPPEMRELASREEMRAANADPLRTVVTPDGWKFTYSQLGYHELYDLSADPGETRNLYAEERAKAAELAAKIRAWQVKYRDIIDPVSVG
jgi:arylsulfatase A-like enzyme